MVSRVQNIRSTTKLARPAAGNRTTGEIYVNFADKQIGVIDPSKVPQDLLAVRFFSPSTDYVAGDHIVYQGRGYRAIGAVPAGPFNSSQWYQISVADVSYSKTESDDLFVNASGDTMSGPLVITDTTPSSSSSTGALTVDGGIGVRGAVTGDDFITGTGFLATQGYVIARAEPGGSANFVMQSPAGSVQWRQSWVEGGHDLTFTSQAIGGGYFVMTSNGDFIANGNIEANSNFISTNTSAVLSPATPGSVRLRPNGAAEGAGEALLGTNGEFIAEMFVPREGIPSGYRCKTATTPYLVGSNYFNFLWKAGVGLIGSVDETEMGIVTFSSDYRIKQEVEDLPSMWETAKALRPISYTYNDWTPPWEAENPDTPIQFVADGKERWGFIAHELQDTLIEDAASGTKDQANHIQAPNPWTLLATLTKALQEAMTRIEALEAQASTATQKGARA